MFQSGEKVVLVRDNWPNFIALYDDVPKKGLTYTVREVRLGRVKIEDPGDENNSEVVITLNEIKNGPDPHFIGGFVELAFRADRFRKVDEIRQKKEQKASQGMLF